MEDLFNKMFYTGIGLISMTKKKVDEVIDRLVEEGKLSEKEGEEIMKDFKSEAGKTRAEFEKDLRNIMEKILKKLDIPTRKDHQQLENRIAALEMKHQQASMKEPAKKAGK